MYRDPLQPEDTGASASVPEFTAGQWGQLGAGAALVLLGSGLLSVGAVLRLAIVAGGGLLAYTTWRDAAGAALPSGAAPANDPVQSGTDSVLRGGAPGNDLAATRTAAGDGGSASPAAGPVSTPPVDLPGA